MKLPALPTSKLALAFRPPYPKWLPCDSLLGMKQRLITREKDKVTWTKYYLSNFKGFLHLGLPYIKIISPIGVGMDTFRLVGSAYKHLEKCTTYLFTFLLQLFPYSQGMKDLMRTKALINHRSPS